LLINQLIDETNKRAGYYTGLLFSQGFRPDYDDVVGELGLAYAEAVNKYGTQGTDEANLKTYCEGFFRIQMARYRHRMSKEQAGFQVELFTPCAVDPGSDVGLIIAEIDQQLSKQDKSVFAFMLNGGKRPRHSGYYNSVSRVRQVAKQVMEVRI